MVVKLLVLVTYLNNNFAQRRWVLGNTIWSRFLRGEKKNDWLHKNGGVLGNTILNRFVREEKKIRQTICSHRFG